MPDAPRIALITTRDPRDRFSWSGTHYHVAQALERHVGPVVLPGVSRPAVRRHLDQFAGLMKRYGRMRYNVSHSIVLSRAHAAFYAERLASERCDLIFANAASTEIAYLRTRLPIVYASDATFAAIIDYYPEFSGFCAASRAEGNHIERRTIRKAAAIVYASDWAARSATTTYGAPTAKVHVVPFGANLDGIPPRAEVLQPSSNGCRLLLVGTDWQRKGADIACDTVRHLRAAGIDASLTICGRQPPAPIADPHVRVIPFLRQQEPEQREALLRLYREADIFLLPTRAECAGIAFSEASAFGLPIVATDTGGVATAVRPGVNGVLLPPAAGAADYAAAIRALLADRPTFEALRQSSRTAYDTRLNWDAWGAAVAEVIRGVLAQRR